MKNYPELVTLNLGFRKFEITKQARLAFYAYVIMVVSLLVSFIVVPKEVLPINIYMMIFALMVTTITGTYAVNCLIIGKCYIYANILTWLLVVLASIYVVITIFILYKMIPKGISHKN
uniref:Uncharacterized protein n=1 Tax=viral metagenome TaxID=1070528 RepID=A0A6C0CSR9_9ZZZZ